MAPGRIGRLLARLDATTAGLVVPPVLLLGAVLAGGRLGQGPVLCLFRRTVGLPCAGCGLTRGLVALVGGDPVAATDHNPFTVFVAAGLVVWWGWAALATLGRAPAPRVPRPVAVAFGLSLAAFWVARDVAFFLLPDAWARMQHDAPLMWLVGRIVEAVSAVLD